MIKPTIGYKKLVSTLTLVTVAGLSTPMLSGCPAVLGVTAVTAVTSAIDRRTVGTQVEDRTIQVKAIAAINDKVGDGVHVNVTVYNRKLLLTGEAVNASLVNRVEGAVSNIDNLKTVVNDIQVAGLASMTSRSNDAIITGKVKAAFLDNAEVDTSAIKVTTEASVVYLMGLVTNAEGNMAAQAASRVSGVKKVVKVFDYISDAELRQIKANAGKKDG